MKKLLMILSLIMMSMGVFPQSDDIEISLITIGPGEPVYVWWGHTALVVTDNTEQQKYFVNFGLFNFGMENFYLNFVLGRLYFMVGASSYESEIRHYSAQDRWIVEQKLNLTGAQKMILYEKLRKATSPENRVYRYDHLYNNCVTRPRDLLNEIMNDAIYQASTESSGLSLREHMRRFTSDKHFLQWWLMYAQGGVIDKEASQWDSMFLPVEFHNALLEIPGLVEEETVISPILTPVRNKPENILYYLLPFAAGLLLALIPGLHMIIPRNRILTVLSHIQEHLLLILLGILGGVLLFLVFFTEHSVVKQNFNTILTPVFTLAPFFIPKRFKPAAKSAVWRTLWVIACLMLILQPLIPHKNANIVLTFLPVYTVYGAGPIIQTLLKRSKRHSMVYG